MPEYSSTTITPADGVKTPAMNGSTSGNYTLAALRAFVLASKGLANGLASLDANGKLPTSQLPDLADDVLVYGSYALLPSPGTAGKLYITADDNKMYRWDADLATPAYVELSVDLSAYATKAELAAEESAREAADTDLKNALQATNARVENLEEAQGGYYEVTAKSPYTIPSGKAKNWSVNVLRGVTRARNNHVDYTKETHYNASVSISGTEISSTTSVNGGYFGFTSFPVVNGHSYLIAFNVKTKASSSIVLRFLGTNGWIVSEVGRPSQGQNAYLISPSVNDNNGQLYWYGEVGKTDIYDDFVYTDLTLYFNGTIPSDADTIAEIQQNYPELLVPSAYGSSLVSTRYEGVRTPSINIWDEVTEEGYINVTTGENVASSAYLRSKNHTLCSPSTSYYLNCDPSQITIVILFYNASGAYDSFLGVGSIKNKAFTTPSTARSFRMYFDKTYYNNDVQVCLDSATEKTTYHPHILDTLSLPTPVTLRSAGSVAEEFDLETGEKTNPLGRINLGNNTLLDWKVNVSYGFYSYGRLSDAKLPADNSEMANIFCDRRVSSSFSNLYDAGVNGGRIAILPDGRIAINSTSADVTALLDELNNVYLDYELATPDAPTQLELIQNPYLATESGGTISSILTDAVDDSMTLGYINL